MLDEAGYLDTDGDGVREMPDGSRPLEFRYVERSEGQNSSAIREFMIGFMEQIGIALVVEVMDNSQLYDAQVRGEYDMFEWGWTPFVDPDPMLSYFTCDQVTTDPDEPGSNDANWCDERYDELYEQQKVELDPERRREIVAEMLRLFNGEATYLVLSLDPDLQAYRTDRFEGWLQQPAEIGPVLFTNTSPTYANLTVIEDDAARRPLPSVAHGARQVRPGEARRRGGDTWRSSSSSTSSCSASSTTTRRQAVPRAQPQPGAARPPPRASSTSTGRSSSSSSPTSARRCGATSATRSSATGR